MHTAFKALFYYIKREGIDDHEKSLEVIVVTRITSEYNSVGIGSNKDFYFSSNNR